MKAIVRFSRIAGRILALVCLYFGLSLAARLLGAGGGSVNPIALHGATAFTWLAIFATGYLFAAVGIWIGSAWGTVVAMGIALVEILIALFGAPAIRLPAIDFVMALFVLVIAAALFVVVEIRLFSGANE